MNDPGLILLALAAVGVSTGVLLCYLLFIWWLDRYEREPFWVVLLTFIWGALGGTCLSCWLNSWIQVAAAGAVGKAAANVFTTVMVAPTVEEFMKALVFLPLVAFGRQVDNRTDGLIYGAATGLGFACLENLYYYANNASQGAGALFAIIIMRTLFSALVHCTSSAMLGMAIGHASHRSGVLRWLVWPFIGYCCAVLNHALWNGMATLSSATAGGALLLGIAFLIGVSLLMFILTQSSLHAEHKIIRHYLTEEARRGFLPLEHAEIIPYWLKRRRAGWLPSHLDKEDYIRAATLLAFRHHQLEIAQGDRRQEYLEEIAKHRQALAAMLGRGGARF